MKRKNLKLFRMKQGLTSKEMAKKLGANYTYYSNIENGRVDPSYNFCKTFGEIFKGQYEDFWEIFKKVE